jgi:shikimate dehydrogenase
MLHQAVYQRLGLSIDFQRWETCDVAAIIAKIKQDHVGLTAVTMPLKKSVLSAMDECSSEVQATGAVNTIIFRDGLLHGYNTDVDGVAYALRDIVLTQKNVLVIGAGGAAQSVAYVLQQSDANLCWLNRTHVSATSMLEQYGGCAVTWSEVYDLPLDIIVNTTPLGMMSNVALSPLPGYSFQPHQVVVDCIYRPLKTRLLLDAELAGAYIISGLDMFLAQGLCQIERFTSQTLGYEPWCEYLKTLLENAIKMNELQS